MRIPLAVALMLSSLACRGRATPDLVLRGGFVYTMDATRRWADAVAVSNGKIVYVGSSSGAEALATARTRVFDLKGRMVLPGFHDSHVHPVSGGVELGQCDLNGLTSAEQVYEAIRKYSAEHRDRPWVVGGGWDLPLFPDANPRREALDALVPDKPAYLSAADGHSAWVNSRALEKSGITKDTPDPPQGRIEREAGTGVPSGALRESAMDLVAKNIPKLTSADRIEGLRKALAMANRFGITSLQEASATEEILEAYRELDRRRELTARVLAAQYVDPAQDEAQVPELVKRRARYAGERLRATAAKIFADGVIESHTAALLEPYVDRPGDRGIANLEPDLFNRLVARLDREGFQLHVHAIGDRGVRLALDALEAAEKANGRRDARHTIAHLELIHPDDRSRFARLGVVANFQPLWAYRDPYISKLTEPVLGPERSRWLYPIGSVARTGAVLAAGSDWSVSSMNPLEATQIAVTRRGLTDSRGESWLPEERIDLATMLAAYTVGGAYVFGHERETGSIEVGKAADLVVLDRNLFSIPPQDIHRTKVLLTLLEGREVFRAPEF